MPESSPSILAEKEALSASPLGQYIVGHLLENQAAAKDELQRALRLDSIQLNRLISGKKN